ncbi:MAG: glycosyltransferase family 2 protein [Pseudomonadota bacterium]
MKLSIVTTLYNSERHLQEFHQRASKAAKGVAGDDYEIVMVNDGSPDGSLAMAVGLSEEDPHVIVIDLSRNFGHHKAMMTGLDHARGDLVFLIDSDLEEQPEWLEEFHAKLDTGGHDVVFGVQDNRKGGWFERQSGSAFYRIFNAVSDVPLPADIVTTRLMRRDYVRALVAHREREMIISGLWAMTGFDQQPHTVKKASGSKTTYTLRRKVVLAINAITSFSNTPLVMIFYFGLTISVLASIYIAFLVFNWAFLARPLSGWTSLMGSIWLLGGLIISFIGVIGIYLAKIFTETKQRPYTIVRQIHGQRKD